MKRHVFTNANLLDGNSPAQPGTTVIVEGERITEVASNGQRPPLRDSDQIYDLKGKTLMPGMITGHFHTTYHNLGAEPGLPTAEHPPAFTAYRGLANAQLALRAGFTGAVGAGCSYDIDASLEQAIEQGLFEGPRLVPCSRDTLSSYDNLMPWWLEIPVKSGVDNCDGPDELRKAVRRNAQRGARMIKLTTSGGHGVPVGTGLRVFTFEEIRVAVEAAHDLGLRVRTHVVGKPYILECIRAGVDILDHCDFMDEECIEAIVEADIMVLPSLYLPSQMLGLPQLFGFATEQTRKEFEWMCNMLPTAVEAGVKLCVGDDFGTPASPHGDYGKELAVYVEQANIDPLEVIRWATRNGAALLGRPDDLGMIEVGRLADLIVVNGDPVRDITLLGDPVNIPGVMRDGVFYSGATLAPDNQY